MPSSAHEAAREVSLTLVSDGASAHSEPVDYVLEYQPQRSLLISATHPSVLIGESKTLGDDRPVIPKGTAKPDDDEHPSSNMQLAAPLDWHGKELRVAVARTEERDSDMTVAFNIANNSPRTIELLPPQVQLSGTAKQKHHKAIKAEPVAVKTIDWPHDVCRPVQPPRARWCSSDLLSRNCGSSCSFRLHKQRK